MAKSWRPSLWLHPMAHGPDQSNYWPTANSCKAQKNAVLYHGLRQVVTATMPKPAADALVASVKSGKLKTLGGRSIEAVEHSSGAICHGHARRHYQAHGLQRIAYVVECAIGQRLSHGH